MAEFDLMYNTIGLETLIPDSLPGVALFMRHGDRYTLYKGPDLPFTEKDKDRLLNNNIDHLYIYSGELSCYNKYVEGNLGSMLSDEGITISKKQEILCQASINYIQEVFNVPCKYLKENLDRCKNLIRFILNDVFTPQQLVETLGTLVQYNSYTYIHSVQVSSYCAALYKFMQVPDEDITDILVGAMFHDYGKTYISKEILEKPDKLTALEFNEVKKHSLYGYSALSELNTFSPMALSIVRDHHEKIDGTGYPNGRKEEELSKHARIASIADVYSALTTDRSYRKAMSSEVALKIMENEMRGSFDVYYLAIFTNMFGVEK